MKHIQVHKSYLWNIFVFPLVFVTAVACYPIQKSDLESRPPLGDEKRYPNGTTIGKYTYIDNEGNPVQVKYYADDASYGVEMKSIKMVDTTGESFPTGNLSPTTNIVQNAPNTFDTVSGAKTAADLNTKNYPVLQGSYKSKNHEFTSPYEFLSKDAKSVAKTAPDLLNDNNYPVLRAIYKSKNHEFTSPYEFLNKEVSKTNRYKAQKPNPDYEIFYQNDMKGAKKCSKEKVRVYSDIKENRKIRSVVNDLSEANKFCEPFAN